MPRPRMSSPRPPRLCWIDAAQHECIDRSANSAARGSALAHRPRPLRRRHRAAGPAARRIRAQPASARRDPRRRCRRRRAHCRASMPCSPSTISRRSSRSGGCCAIPIPARRSSGSGRSRSPTAKYLMSARRSPSSLPTTAISPRTPRRWSPSITMCLPAVADCRKAADAGAPAVRRELNTNIAADLQGRLWRCAKRLSARPRMSSTRSFGSIAAPAIRSRAAASSREWRAADDSMTVWASTQKAHDLFQSLTSLLGFDESRLRVDHPRRRRRLRPQALRLS